MSVPVTVCSVTAALDGNASGVCTGAGTTGIPIGTPGTPGTGVTVPITICGIEAALGGTASALCPQPTTPTTPPSTKPSSSPTSVPVSLASATPTPAVPVATSSSSGSGALALTGAPLLFEVAIGAGALLLGLAITRLGRRRAGAR